MGYLVKNKLYFRAPNKAMKEEFKNFVKSEKRIFDFNNIDPLPESLKIKLTPENIENAIFSYYTIYFKKYHKVPRKYSDYYYNIRIFPEYEEFYRNSLPNKKEKLSQEKIDELVQILESDKRYNDELANIYLSNFEKYHCVTKYDWRIKNWGLKFNAKDSNYLGNSGFEFYSCTRPPRSLLTKLANKFPEIKMVNCHYTLDGIVQGNGITRFNCDSDKEAQLIIKFESIKGVYKNAKLC